MSAKKIDLHSIQFGTLNNGIFEKTQGGDGEKTNADYQPQSHPGQLHLKKYTSSYI